MKGIDGLEPLFYIGIAAAILWTLIVIRRDGIGHFIKRWEWCLWDRNPSS
jgi:hypothetical protein